MPRTLGNDTGQDLTSHIGHRDIYNSIGQTELLVQKYDKYSKRANFCCK